MGYRDLVDDFSRVLFYRLLCPNCAHEESKSFTAIHKQSKTLRIILAQFLNEKRKMPNNSIG
jgi:hypothetical protein